MKTINEKLQSMKKYTRDMDSTLYNQAIDEIAPILKEWHDEIIEDILTGYKKATGQENDLYCAYLKALKTK